MAYLKLEKPSEKVPAQRFAAVEPQLFDAIVNMCVEPGKMCMHDMMSIDAAGGAGIAGIHNVRRLSYDKYAARGTEPGSWGQRYVGALCSSPLMASADIPGAAPVDHAPLPGPGLPRPDTPTAAVPPLILRPPAAHPP